MSHLLIFTQVISFSLETILLPDNAAEVKTNTYTKRLAIYTVQKLSDCISITNEQHTITKTEKCNVAYQI